MPNIEHWKQANSNLAHQQGGSQSAPDAAFVTGGYNGTPSRVNWRNLRSSFGLGAASHVALFDHFVGNAGATDTPAPWVATADSTGTALPKGAAGSASGQLELTTAAAAAADFVTLAAGANWTVGAGDGGYIFFEAGVWLDQITETVLEIGLSDAISETSGFAFSDHSVAGVTDVATDAAVFVFDSAEGGNWLVNTANNGTPAAFDTGIAVAIDTWYSLRIEIAPNGDTYFSINGGPVATNLLGVATDAAVGPWVALHTLGTDASTASLDYIGVVGENPIYAE